MFSDGPDNGIFEFRIGGLVIIQLFFVRERTVHASDPATSGIEGIHGETSIVYVLPYLIFGKEIDWAHHQAVLTFEALMFGLHYLFDCPLSVFPLMFAPARIDIHLAVLGTSL